MDEGPGGVVTTISSGALSKERFAQVSSSFGACTQHDGKVTLAATYARERTSTCT